MFGGYGWSTKQPIFVCDSYLPIVRFPELRSADYGTVSLRDLFEETIGRKFARPQQWIEAAAVHRDVASLPDVEAGIPVLKIERVTSVDEDEPIENVGAFFHSERYRHYNKLSSQPVGLAG